MNSNTFCPRCRWHISPEDHFCGSCAYPLVRLKVTPDPDKDLGGASWTIYSGIPITLKVENVGVNPIEIKGLSTDGFEIKWDGNIELPHQLNANEKAELRCSHNAREGSTSRLELRSSSRQSFDFWVRCQKAPEISLVSDGYKFEHDTEEPQPCAMDPAEGRIAFTLHHDSMLQKAPYLSEGEDYFAISGLSQEFPVQLSPERPFKFSFIRRQGFPDETCCVALNFSFDSLGEVIFKFLLRYVERPMLDVEFGRQFVNDDALVSGGKKKISFTMRVDHRSGPPLRITRVDSKKSWLSVKDSITEQNPILDSSHLQIDLLLNQEKLSAVEQNTTVEARLDIHGTTVGEDEAFRESISRPVQIRPPQRLEFPIAVDFGTTNSCIAYIDPRDNNNEKLLELELETGEGISEIPTVLQVLAIKKSDDLLDLLDDLGTDERKTCLKEDDVFVSFSDTLKDLRFSPEDIPSISWGFKRTLRTPDEQITYRDRGTSRISINGRAYARGNRYIEMDAIEKVGLYIRYLLESFQENTGYLPSEAVFTYPAVFNRQKPALRKAIEWATQEMDLKPFLDISEPEAIALDYAMDLETTLDQGQDIVYGVFDCGGGTTDISIVRLTSQNEGVLDLEILASDGDNALGGDLLSFRIAQYLYDQMVPEIYRTQFPFPDTLDQALRNGDDNFSKIYELAEKIKENSRITPDFEDALDDVQYFQREEKGILDLIEDPNITVNWPRISLNGSENTTLNIRGTERNLDETPLADMVPLNIDAIQNAVRKDLEKGFDRLNQMQEYLLDKDLIASVELDYLILEGNSSRFSLIERIVEKKAQAKAIIFKPEKLKKSVARGAIEYGASLTDFSRPRLKGIHKLNYPICRSAFIRFVPIFDRWTPLKPDTTITPEKSSLIQKTEMASREIPLFEVFKWNLNSRVTQGGNRIVAKLNVPKDDEAFQNAQFWTYCLELRCDAEGKASLWYNYRVGNEEDGSDFKFVWEEHRICDNFSYT